MLIAQARMPHECEQGAEKFRCISNLYREFHCRLSLHVLRSSI